MDTSTAFEDGRRAALRGEPVSRNPFSATGPTVSVGGLSSSGIRNVRLHDAWDDGWYGVKQGNEP